MCLSGFGRCYLRRGQTFRPGRALIGGVFRQSRLFWQRLCSGVFGWVPGQGPGGHLAWHLQVFVAKKAVLELGKGSCRVTCVRRKKKKASESD